MANDERFYPKGVISVRQQSCQRLSDSAGQGKNSQEYLVYFKNFSRRMAEKDPPFGRFVMFQTKRNDIMASFNIQAAVREMANAYTQQHER